MAPLRPLASKLFVPQGAPPYHSPQIIYFSPDGRPVPLVTLKNKSTPIFNGAEPVVITIPAATMVYRTIWPGYTHTFCTRTIDLATFDRTQLAAEIARQVAAFLCKVKDQNITSNEPKTTDGIVEHNIGCQNVYLSGIVNTSGKSWQPIIFLGSDPSNSR